MRTIINIPLKLFRSIVHDEHLRFFSLSARRTLNGVLWNDDEVRRLKECIAANTDLKSIIAEFATEFAGRSKDSVKAKIYSLRSPVSPKIKYPPQSIKFKISRFNIPWTPEDILKLKKCAEDDEDLNSIMMKFPQRRIQSIVDKLARLGLNFRRLEEPGTKRGKRRPWSTEDDATLLAYVNDHHAKSKSVRENLNVAPLATQLRRTAMSVWSRISRLKNSISTPWTVRLWTEEDTRLISKWRAEGVKVKVIAERLGRSAGSIETQIGKIKNRSSE